jgi:hypothetical protein
MPNKCVSAKAYVSINPRGPYGTDEHAIDIGTGCGTQGPEFMMFVVDNFGRRYCSQEFNRPTNGLQRRSRRRYFGYGRLTSQILARTYAFMKPVRGNTRQVGGNR